MAPATASLLRAPRPREERKQPRQYTAAPATASGLAVHDRWPCTCCCVMLLPVLLLLLLPLWTGLPLTLSRAATPRAAALSEPAKEQRRRAPWGGLSSYAVPLRPHGALALGRLRSSRLEPLCGPLPGRRRVLLLLLRYLQGPLGVPKCGPALPRPSWREPDAAGAPAALAVEPGLARGARGVALGSPGPGPGGGAVPAAGVVGHRPRGSPELPGPGREEQQAVQGQAPTAGEQQQTREQRGVSSKR